jgi:hypothetical protein
VNGEAATKLAMEVTVQVIVRVKEVVSSGVVPKELVSVSLIV